ncbi:hypothetical protein GW17_00042212 [Ensete ventricosum]|nr:hypothetical protein GW17_00042212 [Ensete ventricosum]
MGMGFEADLLDFHAGKAIGDGGVLLHFRLLRPEGVVREWVRVHHRRGHHRSSAASTAMSLHAACSSVVSHGISGSSVERKVHFGDTRSGLVATWEGPRLMVDKIQEL